jgi:hypothetical protein
MHVASSRVFAARQRGSTFFHARSSDLVRTRALETADGNAAQVPSIRYPATVPSAVPNSRDNGRRRRFPRPPRDVLPGRCSCRYVVPLLHGPPPRLRFGKWPHWRPGDRHGAPLELGRGKLQFRTCDRLSHSTEYGEIDGSIFPHTPLQERLIPWNETNA